MARSGPRSLLALRMVGPHVALAAVRQRDGRPLPDEDLEPVLARFGQRNLGLAVTSVRPLKLGASSLNYLLSAPDGDFVARLDVMRSSADLRDDRLCMEACREAGVRTPPSPFFEGQLLDIPISVRGFVPGPLLDDLAKPPLLLFSDAGKQLARVHRAALPTRRPWFYGAPPTVPRGLPQELRSVVALAQSWLKHYQVPAADRSMTHTDFRASNLVADGSALTVIDWEKAAEGPRWFDFGLALFHLIGAPALNAATLRATTFRQGYEDEARSHGLSFNPPEGAVAVAAATYILVDVEIYCRAAVNQCGPTVDASHAAYFHSYCLPTFRRFADRIDDMPLR